MHDPCSVFNYILLVFGNCFFFIIDAFLLMHELLTRKYIFYVIFITDHYRGENFITDIISPDMTLRFFKNIHKTECIDIDVL